MLHLRRLLILCHRYLGIAISFVVVVWFASGIVMMYAGGMPRVDPQLRLERLPTLDLARVQLSPHDAAQRAAAAGITGQPSLTTVLGRPAYRFQGREAATLFADSGELLDAIDVGTAQALASGFLDVPVAQVRLDRTVTEPDQWTLNWRGRGGSLYKFEVDDGLGTQVYVSAQTADITQLTTRRQRALAWMGTIPHWIYFSALRTNQPRWSKIVVGLSAVACVLAVLGMILTITQFRRTQPFRWSLAVPYRGWMRWHYILGAIFGVFAFTWAFSGLLSMEPFAWTNASGLEIPRDVFSGGEPDLASFGSIDGTALQRTLGQRSIKELGFRRIHDQNYYDVAVTDDTGATRAPPVHEPYSVERRNQADALLVDAATLTLQSQGFSSASILQRVQAVLPPGVHIAEHTVLNDYDSYYYSRNRQAPLPVLRIKFDDPTRTWLYVDPATSDVVAFVHRFSRLERWLYNGLHSLDFKFWYSRRPLWDLGMLVLLLGGLAMSTLGLYLGVKRLIRDLRSIRSASM